MASPGSVVIQFLVDAKKAAGDAAKLATQFGKVDTEADALDRTLDQLESEIDSIGRGAATLSNDMRKAGVGFDTVGDEAEQAADRVRRAAQDMADGVHDGGRKIDTETDGIRQNMGDTGREAGNEFIGNMAEGIGSGTGTIADTVQGTLGGLVNMAATIAGPVGIAAAGAAAGVGIVFSKVKAEAEKTQAEIKELIDALWEVNSTTSEIAKQKIWEDWQADLKEDAGLLGDLADAMRVAKIPADEMQDAITGDPAAQQAVVDKLKKVGAEIADNVKKGKPLTEDQRDYLSNQGRIHEQLKKSGIEIGKAADAQSDLEAVTGRAADESEKYKEEIKSAIKYAKGLNEEMDAAARDRNATINVAIKYKDPSGKPTNARPVGLAAGEQTVGVTQFAAPPPPMVVNVTLPTEVRAHITEEQIYRAVERLVMRGNARNGRRVIVG